MKEKNLFDEKLQISRLMPEEMRVAATDLTDTLDLCWAAVQSVFERHARPEHALQLLPQFMQRADAERLQRQARFAAGTAAAAKPRARKARSPQ